ncbi:MAG: hypothetical protein Kow0080_14890 [Candidatus Promineifilaceae bacterium]
MDEKRPLRRHTFILILWAEAGVFPGSQPVWRVSLEDTQTARRYGFKDLAELTRFLERQTVIDLPDEKF